MKKKNSRNWNGATDRKKLFAFAIYIVTRRIIIIKEIIQS